MLTAGADGELHLLDLRKPNGNSVTLAAPKGKGKKGKATSAYTSCAFDSSGAFCIGGTAEGVVRVWKTKGASFVKELSGSHSKAVTAVAAGFEAEARGGDEKTFVASCSLDRSLKFFAL